MGIAMWRERRHRVALRAGDLRALVATALAGARREKL
jgi:hypothetical protein